jgi:hypothetical protein
MRLKQLAVGSIAILSLVGHGFPSEIDPARKHPQDRHSSCKADQINQIYQFSRESKPLRNQEITNLVWNHGRLTCSKATNGNSQHSVTGRLQLPGLRNTKTLLRFSRQLNHPGLGSCTLNAMASHVFDGSALLLPLSHDWFLSLGRSLHVVTQSTQSLAQQKPSSILGLRTASSFPLQHVTCTPPRRYACQVLLI